MADATERRTSRRFTMALSLTLRLHGSSGPVEKRAETRDVSFRGLYFWTQEEFEAGIPIEFVLTLPREITMTRDVNIHCFGRVIRVEPQRQSRAVWLRVLNVTNFFPSPHKHPIFVAREPQYNAVEKL